MPLRVEVKSAEVTVKSWQKADRKGEINEQTGWIDLPSGERRRLVISIENKNMPYQPGVYVISDDSFEVDRFGGLSIGRLRLVPVAAQAAEKPAQLRG